MDLCIGQLCSCMAQAPCKVLCSLPVRLAFGLGILKSGLYGLQGIELECRLMSGLRIAVRLEGLLLQLHKPV